MGKLQEKYNEQLYVFHSDSPMVKILLHVVYHLSYCNSNYSSFDLFVYLQLLLLC